jgi:hypothetical protein
MSAKAEQRDFKASAYETKGTSNDELGDLATKLQEDLRKSIHGLRMVPVCSRDWNDIADVMGRIATISEMERSLPQEKEGATLWETEEAALRYVLEDGKLNLCLRMLLEFHEWKADAAAKGSLDGLVPDQAAKLDKFEKGCGRMLRNAWKHAEALQTTDLPALISYIGTVLLDACHNYERIEAFERMGDLADRQGVMVIHYLKDLVQTMTDDDESRVMPFVREHKLFPRLARFLLLFAAKLSEHDLIVAVQALAAVCDTEHFQTYDDSYANEEESDICAELVDSFVDALADDLDIRRTIRPFLDWVKSAAYR